MQDGLNVSVSVTKSFEKKCIDANIIVSVPPSYGIKSDEARVSVKGSFHAKAEGFVFEAQCEYCVEAPCSSCLKNVPFKSGFGVSERFVSGVAETGSLNADEEVFLIKDSTADLREAVRMNLLLALPSKFLCKEDCKGLCLVCGADLNDITCQCEKPMSELQMLIEGGVRNADLSKR